jgi:hypothetical protein
LTSAPDEVERSASCPGRFTPRERAPSTHGIRDWVGIRAVLDAVVKRKIPSPYRDSKHRTPNPWPSVIPLSYPGSKDMVTQRKRVARKQENTKLYFLSTPLITISFHH